MIQRLAGVLEEMRIHPGCIDQVRRENRYDRACVRAIGDDFGASLLDASFALKPNIVSGGTLRKRDRRKAR